MKISRIPFTSIKTRFTSKFIWALKNLNKNKKPISYHKVKLAAYTSMASAVGPTRTWSRVLLLRSRTRQLSRVRVVSKRRIGTRKCIKKGAKHQKKKVVYSNDEEEEGIEKLRELVPGGEVMGYSSLLDESAHYIKCLNMQVQIMRNIADFLSV